MVVFAVLTVIMIIIGVTKLPESLRQHNVFPAAATNHAPMYDTNTASQFSPSQFAPSQFVSSQFPPSSYQPMQKPVHPPTTSLPPYEP